MKEGSSGGASLCEGFHEGDLAGGLLYWGTQKNEVFEGRAKCPVNGASLSIQALLGNMEEVRLPGLLREKYICVPFLDPEAIKILSLGAIWNFIKGTELS